MASKNISLNKDAYERLKALKREGESFSDVILRLTGNATDPLDYVGGWSDLPDEKIDEIKHTVARARKDLSRRFEVFADDTN